MSFFKQMRKCTGLHLNNTTLNSTKHVSLQWTGRLNDTTSTLSLQTYARKLSIIHLTE